MFRPLMAQPCMGGVGRGRLAERFRSHDQFAGSVLGGSTGGDFMEQYAGINMGGSSGSASESNRSKLFSPPRPAAKSAAHFLGALLCKLRCLRSTTRVLFLAFLSSVVSASQFFGSICYTCFESLASFTCKLGCRNAHIFCRSLLIIPTTVGALFVSLDDVSSTLLRACSRHAAQSNFSIFLR